MNFLCLGGVLICVQLSFSWWVSFVVKAAGFGLCFMGLRELAELCRIQGQRSGSEAEPEKVSGGLWLGRTVREIMSREVGSKSELQGLRLGAIELIKKWCAAGGVISGAAAVWTAFLSFRFPPERLVSLGDDGKRYTRVVYNAFGLGGTVEKISQTVCGAAATLAVMAVLGGLMALLIGNDGHELVMELSDGTERKDKSFHFTLDPLEVRRLGSAAFNLSLCMGVNLCCDVLNRLLPWDGPQVFFGFLAVLSKVTLYVFVMIMGYNFNHVRISCNKKYDSEVR